MSRGRHRKPSNTGRNTAALAVAGAVGTGGFVAIAPSADAASGGSVWDRLADCESSGNWSIDTGNGYSGGLQFSPSTWRTFGGGAYAPTAAQASRAEQIAVATRVQAGQGWGAWPACTKKLGISGTPDSGGAAVAPRGKAQRQAAPKAAAKTAPTAKATPRGKSSSVAGLGVRAADGTGRYVCTTDKLLFAACDPDTLGTIQQYPLYDGRKASAAPTAPVTGRSVAALAQPAAPAASSAAAAVASGARNYLGVPYVWGGESRSGMDCSGLVYRVLMDRGIAAPRTSAGQYAWTKRITAAEAKPGDLVFFYSPVSHVGIYVGNGQMIDSSQPGTRIQVRNVYPGAKFGRIPG